VNPAIVRRFDVPVTPPDTPVEVARRIVEAVRAHPERVHASVQPSDTPPVVRVRLEGPAAAVVAIVATLRAAGAQVRRDHIRLPLGADHPPYPDLVARVLMSADLASPKPAGSPVTVAIVDSGIMATHPALERHLRNGSGAIHGMSVIGDRRDVRDRDGHGTMLAGAVLSAAAGASVALRALKFFDPATPPRPDAAAAAIDAAVSAKARIILLSWDVGIGSPRLERSFARACESALVVIAAGNMGSSNDFHGTESLARVPARYAPRHPATAISVMATDDGDEKAWFSNYGRTSVDLAAPGVDVATTRRSVSNVPTDGPTAYRTFNGTSAAAAHVAGAAALLMSRHPRLTAATVKRCLVESVDAVPRLTCTSSGRLNIMGALARAAAEEASLYPGKPAARRSRANRSRRPGSRIG
jgi:subtilisin family serine protease